MKQDTNRILPECLTSNALRLYLSAYSSQTTDLPCLRVQYIPASSNLTLILPIHRLLIILSRATAQSLAFLGRDAKERTYFLRIPSHFSIFPSTRSGATTDGNAVIAYDAYVADRVSDIGLCISFPLLFVLAEVQMGTTLKIAGRRRAHRTGATVTCWTCDLTV